MVCYIWHSGEGTVKIMRWFEEEIKLEQSSSETIYVKQKGMILVRLLEKIKPQRAKIMLSMIVFLKIHMASAISQDKF